MKLRVFITVICYVAVLSVCLPARGAGSSVPESSPLAQASAKPSSPVATRPFPSAKGARIEIEHREAAKTPIDLWERIRSDLSFEKLDKKQVDKALDEYRSQPNYLSNMSEGSSLYLYYIVDEVQKRDMPMEIALVPLVESGLNPFTRSPSNAAGLWQITAATGANLGLEQSTWFDGRRSIHDSTEVALDYLERLHRAFDGDWLLALAAYNAGEGRVARARQSNLDKGLPTDFWSLDLPAETRRFVPKILALSQIVAEPETHNVNLPPVENAPAFEVAAIDGQITLARAADLADISLETLQDLNPGQLRSATAPGQIPGTAGALRHRGAHGGGTGATLRGGSKALAQLHHQARRHPFWHRQAISHRPGPSAQGQRNCREQYRCGQAPDYSRQRLGPGALHHRWAPGAVETAGEGASETTIAGANDPLQGTAR